MLRCVIVLTVSDIKISVTHFAKAWTLFTWLRDNKLNFYITKLIFWQNMEMICHFYPIAYYIYVFGQCLVGFGCIAVVRPFEITEIIW